MIVMKFGGSSLASTASIRRVIEIVRSQAVRHPIIVASAMGDTTDCLDELLHAARRSNRDAAEALQEKIKALHEAACRDLLPNWESNRATRDIRETLRDVNTRMLKLSSGEILLTPELKDWTLSVGEQLSSALLAHALKESCLPALHVDARKLILTDDKFGNARPQYWETYARIRSFVAAESPGRCLVMAGFIGSTEDGRTTTLGRGGSDLTAAIAGSAIHVDEIQVWKDVDGMLTFDPRLLPGGRPVKHLTYEEALELANGGATILHPGTMAPPQRLRIPITIRNTFKPESEGTRIGALQTPREPDIKSIAVRSNVTLLRIVSSDETDDLGALLSYCNDNPDVCTLLSSSPGAAYIALDPRSKIPDESLASDRCLQVTVRPEQAILTIVGEFRNIRAVANKIRGVLRSLSFVVLPHNTSDCSIRIAVRRADLRKSLTLIDHYLLTKETGYDGERHGRHSVSEIHRRQKQLRPAVAAFSLR